MISPGLTDALDRWLAELLAIGGRARNTVDAYRTDLMGFFAFLQSHEGGSLGTGHIARIDTGTMRSWMAHERGRGLGPRSLGTRALGGEKLRRLAGRTRRLRPHRRADDPQPEISPASFRARWPKMPPAP